jgi:uncharacterized membrane protein YqaE (UPF0057 family)
MGCPSGRLVGLLVTSVIMPPVAVLIVKNSFDNDFWINLLLTLLAWLPGCIHAVWVLTRQDGVCGRAAYQRLPATLP